MYYKMHMLMLYLWYPSLMSVYYIMSEPDFILDGFLCDSLSIGDSSYPQLESLQEPPEPPGTVHSDISYYKKIQTLRVAQTYLVNKNSRVISTICHHRTF